MQYTCEQSSTSEHHPCAKPVMQGEGIPEVEDWEEEADKLPESDYQCDHQGWTLCCQDEHSTNANIPEVWSYGGKTVCAPGLI